MPTDSAFIEMTPMDSTGRPVNHVSSSNAADHQGDGVRLTNLRPGAPRHAYIFLIRITQLVFVSIYLALLVHCVLHKGWWLYVDLPLGLGTTACAAAYLAIAYTAFRMFDRTERRIFAWHFACLIDTMLFVHWMVTFITMCMPKGKDYKHLFEFPPYYPWYFGTIFCAAITISFGITAYRISVNK